MPEEAAATVREYSTALRTAEPPPPPFFAEREAVVKVGVGERLVGSTAVAADRRE